eukprot:Gb_38625 [translate_table: standard]
MWHYQQPRFHVTVFERTGPPALGGLREENRSSSWLIHWSNSWEEEQFCSCVDGLSIPGQFLFGVWSWVAIGAVLAVILGRGQPATSLLFPGWFSMHSTYCTLLVVVV